METYGIEKLGIVNPKAVYRNLTPAQLTEAALRRGEGKLSNTGALVVTTGKYTGPVSYTHLDVYKRQSSPSFFSFAIDTLYPS